MQRNKTVHPITNTPQKHVIQTTAGDGGWPVGVGEIVGIGDGSSVLLEFVDLINIRK